MTVTVGTTTTVTSSGSNGLTLPAPTGVGFYVVNVSGETPLTSPDLTGLTYAMRFPTGTPWEGGLGFMLALDGTSGTIPELTWTWDDTVTVAYVMYNLSSCAFVLSAANLVFTPNYSPTGIASADFSLRGFLVNGGDGEAASPPSLTPIATIGVGMAPVEAFFDSPSSPSATVIQTNPPDHDDDQTWSTNGSLGPYVGWGATLSVYEASATPPAATGWHVGRVVGL